MKHEPGGRFHVAATEDLITEQRQDVAGPGVPANAIVSPGIDRPRGASMAD